MLPPELGSHAFLKIRNPIRNPELELHPNLRSGAPKNRIFEKLTWPRLVQGHHWFRIIRRSKWASGHTWWIGGSEKVLRQIGHSRASSSSATHEGRGWFHQSSMLILLHYTVLIVDFLGRRTSKKWFVFILHYMKKGFTTGLFLGHQGGVNSRKVNSHIRQSAF